MHSEVDSKDKLTKPFVDKIYQDYLNKGGATDETIKSYIHVFVISMYFAMNRLEENYKEIFNNLSTMTRDDFYKYVFKKGNDDLQSSTLFCCMMKDIYDKDFTKISTGGYAADILMELAKIMEDETVEVEEDMIPLAQEWGINQMKLAYYLTADGITDDIKRYLDCQKITPLSHDLNPNLLQSAIMENFAAIEKSFRIKIGLDSILKDTKLIHGKWTERTAASQDKPKVRWSLDSENYPNTNHGEVRK
jgi:hypothetical protein